MKIPVAAVSGEKRISFCPVMIETYGNFIRRSRPNSVTVLSLIASLEDIADLMFRKQFHCLYTKSVV